MLIFTGLHLKAQQINLREVNAPFETVYKEIQKQTDYHFAGTTELLNKAQTVNVNLVNAPLNEALAQIFSDQPLSYTIYNKMVIIKDKEIPDVKEKVSLVDAVVQQTYSIIGTVRDEKGELLPGATVFISNSTYIQATNKEGKFSFGNIRPGTYEVVVKMIGFVTNTQTITLREKAVKLDIVLKESITNLNAVTITGPPKPKPSNRDIRWFFNNFIGTSPNAAQCKILNPDVLNIVPEKKGQYKLEASTKDFLEIENDALGYKIKYLLKKFIFYAQYDVCYYEGSAYFEELKGTGEQQKLWEKNREKAYLGSARHFFRAALNGTSRAEGFFTYRVNEHKGPSPLTPLDIDNMLVTVNKDQKALISIPYGKPRTDLYIYYIWGAIHEDQLAWVKQCVDTVTIDKNGGTTPGGYEFFNAHINVAHIRGLMPGVGYSFWGRWASQRVADLTPLDYFVQPELDSAFLKPAVNTSNLKKNASIKKLHDILPIYIDSLIGRRSLYGIENKQAADAAKKN